MFLSLENNTDPLINVGEWGEFQCPPGLRFPLDVLSLIALRTYERDPKIFMAFVYSCKGLYRLLSPLFQYHNGNVLRKRLVRWCKGPYIQSVSGLSLVFRGILRQKFHVREILCERFYGWGGGHVIHFRSLQDTHRFGRSLLRGRGFMLFVKHGYPHTSAYGKVYYPHLHRVSPRLQELDINLPSGDDENVERPVLIVKRWKFRPPSPPLRWLPRLSLDIGLNEGSG